jgi:hypothetical protein
MNLYQCDEKATSAIAPSHFADRTRRQPEGKPRAEQVHLPTTRAIRQSSPHSGFLRTPLEVPRAHGRSLSAPCDNRESENGPMTNPQETPKYNGRGGAPDQALGSGAVVVRCLLGLLHTAGHSAEPLEEARGFFNGLSK